MGIEAVKNTVGDIVDGKPVGDAVTDRFNEASEDIIKHLGAISRAIPF